MEPKIGFQALAESHGQPFVVIDKDFRIVAINQAYERAYATNADQAIGKHCYEISHSHFRPCTEKGEECPHYLVREALNKYCFQAPH